MSQFGKQLYAARRRAQLSQRQLAEAVGINDSYISRVEQGKFAAPSRKVVAALADALGITSPVERRAFLASAGFASDDDHTSTHDQLSALLQTTQQQLAGIQRGLETISHTLNTVDAGLEELAQGSTTRQVVEAVGESLMLLADRTDVQRPVEPQPDESQPLPRGVEVFRGREAVNCVIKQLIQTAADIDNRVSDDKICVTSHGGRGVLESTLSLSEWQEALRKLFSKEWGLSHFIRLDDNPARTTEVVRHMPWRLGGAGKYEALYVSGRDERPHQEFLLVPNIGCLLLFGVGPEGDIDAAMYFPAGSGQYDVLREFYQQQAEGSRPLFTVVQTNPEAFQQEIVRLEAEDGERFLLKDGLSTNTIPIEIDERRAPRDGANPHRDLVINTHLRSRKERSRIFVRQLARYRCREIYPMSAIEEFVRSGEIAKDDFLGTLTGRTERIEERAAHLAYIIDLLERYPNYEIGLLTDSRTITNRYWLGKGDRVVLVKSIPTAGEHRRENESFEEMSFEIEEKHIVEAFSDYFNWLWEEEDIVVDKREVIRWLQEQIRVLRTMSDAGEGASVGGVGSAELSPAS